MCGFAGFVGGHSAGGDAATDALLHRMADAIRHRGPDSSGVWYNEECSVGLAHRRLSVVDLSPAGHQPMTSHTGRYILVCNGEVYNHPDLREELSRAGHILSWSGHSDTETLLAGFDIWGVEKTLKRAVGMFSFALWDNLEKVIILGRDRIGEKPLYYGWQGDAFLFGSELKALKTHPDFKGAINREALALQLRHNYIPAPHSIYEGISKLAPGTTVRVSLRNKTPQTEIFWSATDVFIKGASDPFSGSAEQAVDELESLLKGAIRQQMVSDVPLGAFLSGGIDSSTVVALMQAQSSRPVKTFSIGFIEDGYNEAVHAKVVAEHLGTEHTELYVTPQDAMDVIPKLPALYDEPFSDSSQIPTFLVSQMARQHVTVSLSGDAGDELFCGYQRYDMTSQLWRKMNRAPLFMRRLAAQGIEFLSPEVWSYLARPFRSMFASNNRPMNIGDKIHKGARLLTCENIDDLYQGLIIHWSDISNVVIGAHGADTHINNPIILSELGDIERMMALDMVTYLPDDILVKVDRASMGVSLESRVPFLDHRVVEFAWRLPHAMKVRDGQEKWPVRQVLYKHVPRELIERPKMGFGVPIHDWLRGPLREWAECLLDQKRIENEGYFNHAPIRKKWDEHIAGERNWAAHLWDVLMFQAWLEYQK